MLVALAQIRVRRRLEAEQPERLTLRMWLFPWLSWLTIAAIGAVLIAMAFVPDLASQLYASLACTAVVIAAFWFLRRRHGTVDAPPSG
jgi:L-asparagine transporter-like permease